MGLNGLGPVPQESGGWCYLLIPYIMAEDCSGTLAPGISACSARQAKHMAVVGKESDS